MPMTNEQIFSPGPARPKRPFRGPGARGFRFDFGNANANPFANLTREQRLARLDAVAKLLDIAFILPGTNIRYGIDGIIGLIPVVGDIIKNALSLWLVSEARALGAPWHVTDARQCRGARRDRNGAGRRRRLRRAVP